MKKIAFYDLDCLFVVDNFSFFRGRHDEELVDELKRYAEVKAYEEFDADEIIKDGKYDFLITQIPFDKQERYDVYWGCVDDICDMQEMNCEVHRDGLENIQKIKDAFPSMTIISYSEGNELSFDYNDLRMHGIDYAYWRNEDMDASRKNIENIVGMVSAKHFYHLDGKDEKQSLVKPNNRSIFGGKR